MAAPEAPATRGGARRRAVPRERRRDPSRVVRRPQHALRAVALPRHRSRPRGPVRVERRRDLGDHGRLAEGHVRRRGAPSPARAPPNGADDVLRDAGRRQGLRGGRLLPRERLSPRPRAARQPLDEALPPVTRRRAQLLVAGAVVASIVLPGGPSGAAATPGTAPRIVCTLPPGASKLPVSARHGLIGHLEQYPDPALA